QSIHVKPEDFKIPVLGVPFKILNEKDVEAILAQKQKSENIKGMTALVLAAVLLVKTNPTAATGASNAVMQGSMSGSDATQSKYELELKKYRDLIFRTKQLGPGEDHGGLLLASTEHPIFRQPIDTARWIRNGAFPGEVSVNIGGDLHTIRFVCVVEK
ncbi:MAG: hypothetical protein ABL865_02315, partial [Candidatus Nitrotoga sp.]